MQRFRRWIPSRAEILSYSWLQPIRHHLDHDALWEFERDSVARAVLVGTFIGFVAPLAQIFLGALVAVVLRANVAVSVACTLITNPLTVVPLYFGAYLLGAHLMDLPALSWPMFKATLLHSDSFWDSLTHLWSLLGEPLLLGALVLAISLSVTGYLLVKLLWHWLAAKSP
jgi:uncharacterized protein (DUF2062 family)